jgi:hypothetical protein
MDSPLVYMFKSYGLGFHSAAWASGKHPIGSLWASAEAISGESEHS